MTKPTAARYGPTGRFLSPISLTAAYLQGILHPPAIAASPIRFYFQDAGRFLHSTIVPEAAYLHRNTRRALRIANAAPRMRANVFRMLVMAEIETRAERLYAERAIPCYP